MKKTILFVLVLVLSGVTEEANADFTFGESSLVKEPVSTGSWEYSVCISPDGLELYFSSAGPYGWHDLYVTTRQSSNDHWDNKTNLGPQINSELTDHNPSISSDGLSLYFCRGVSSADDGTIWVTTREALDAPWGPATKLDAIINKGFVNVTPAISGNNLSLYFARWEAGNGDVFVATRPTVSDPWSEAERLPPHINTAFDEISPYVTPDGLCLLFCSASSDYSDDEPRPDGVGEADIWMAKRMSASDEWEEPVFLPVPINTTYDEVDVCISWDGSTLYFCSDRGDDFPGYGVYQAPILPVVDLNGDGIVDSVDMCIIVDHWGTDNQLCDIGPMPWGDGVVDVQDLIILAEHLFEGIPPVEVDEGDADSQVELELGQVLVVTLESNPSTGYRWELAENNDSILKQFGQVEFKSSDTGEPPMVGAGGWEIFRFKAVSAGQMTLELVYHRYWEEVEPLKTFSIQVVVP